MAHGTALLPWSTSVFRYSIALAVAERCGGAVHGILKAWLAHVSLDSPLALQGTLVESALFCNHMRGHHSLGGLTPAQAWGGLTLADLRSCAGQGQWMQALGARSVRYHVRC